jgi:membrane protein implicated in regulation of membrane protease activity
VTDSPVRDGRSPVVTPARAIAGVCLFIPFVAMLWVGSYTQLTPAFIGIPFFYWYQMLWVFISSALTYTAYVLIRREERARKGEQA